MRPDAADQRSRIVLEGVNNEHTCYVKAPRLGSQTFALTIPETIACEEKNLLFHRPIKPIKWSKPDSSGAVSTVWTFSMDVAYSLRIVPAIDYVDASLTVTNLTSGDWHGVWAFNCLNPGTAKEFKDESLRRTYISVDGRPTEMSKLPRRKSAFLDLGVYFHEDARWTNLPVVSGWRATNPTRTDDSWIVTLSDARAAYMAATSPQALFLFDNTAYCCIHSAALLGDIAAGGAKTVTCRFYFAEGDLDTFLARFRQHKLAPQEESRASTKMNEQQP